MYLCMSQSSYRVPELMKLDEEFSACHSFELTTSVLHSYVFFPNSVLIVSNQFEHSCSVGIYL